MKKPARSGLRGGGEVGYSTVAVWGRILAHDDVVIALLRLGCRRSNHRRASVQRSGSRASATMDTSGEAFGAPGRAHSDVRATERQDHCTPDLDTTVLLKEGLYFEQD
jgi:hypothetical protein